MYIGTGATGTELVALLLHHVHYVRICHLKILSTTTFASDFKFDGCLRPTERVTAAELRLLCVLGLQLVADGVE